VNQNGATITGYYTTLRTSAGRQITTGYTQVTFTDVTANTNYEMELDSYASCTFSHWQSSGSPTTDPLPFTQPNGPLTLVGVYNCTSGGAVGGGAPASMLAIVFALLSQFAMPLGLLAAALGSFAVVHIKTVRVAQRNISRA
jgi:hypothetical protein